MGRLNEGIFHRKMYFWYLALFPVKSNGEKDFAGEKNHQFVSRSDYLEIFNMEGNIWNNNACTDEAYLVDEK